MVHVPCIKPLDEDALRDSVAGHDLVVTVEEHSVMGGLGGLVAETHRNRPIAAHRTHRYQ